MTTSQTFVLRFLALMATLSLSGCLGPTPYQVRQFNGGYQEKTVAEDRWYVEFFGNGQTSRDTVFAYWMYRCAELTLQKGYDYFVVVGRTPQVGAALEIELRQVSEEAAGAEQPVVRAKGTGGGAARGPIYTYVPGQTITRWSARGVIQMFKGSPDPDERAYLAKMVADKLGPAVRQASQAGSNLSLPAELRATGENEPAPAGNSEVGVRLDDLKDLLPKE